MPSVQAVDSIEIFDLEYDVASVGAAEASNSEENHASHYIVTYRLPAHSI